MQRQQKKNDRFLVEVEQFVAGIEAEIGQAERRFADRVYASCEHLLQFFRRKSLLHWQRDALLEWLLDNLMILASSPFSDHLDLEALHRQCDAAMESAQSSRQGTAKNSRQNEPQHEDTVTPESAAEEAQRTADMFEDLFAEFEQEVDDTPEDDDRNHDPFEEFFRGQWEQEEARRQKTRALSEVLRGSSVNRLFRKLARVLHPDLEQDEGARERKNQLMGELIEARNGSDIPKIFALYAEHVGESPLLELDGDLETATLLL
ncbi:MAG: hypothetical protein RIC38_11765, partial [Chromatocurvus sp.]